MLIEEQNLSADEKARLKKNIFSYQKLFGLSTIFSTVNILGLAYFFYVYNNNTKEMMMIVYFLIGQAALVAGFLVYQMKKRTNSLHEALEADKKIIFETSVEKADLTLPMGGKNVKAITINWDKNEEGRRDIILSSDNMNPSALFNPNEFNEGDKVRITETRNHILLNIEKL